MHRGCDSSTVTWKELDKKRKEEGDFHIKETAYPKTDLKLGRAWQVEGTERSSAMLQGRIPSLCYMSYYDINIVLDMIKQK